MRFIRFIPACLILGAIQPLSAQVTLPTIDGIVLDSATGGPLRGVVVTAPGGVTTTSLPDGRFTVPWTVRGVGRLELRLPGYRAASVTGVTPAARAPLRVLLVPLPVRLPAIEVLRDRTELSRHAGRSVGSAHVIDRHEFAAHAPLYDDVHETLRQIPGVVVQDEEGFGLRPNIGLRGSGSERSGKITLMEDGVLIAPAPYAAPAAYYFPIMGRMDAVEVRKGASQIKYGPRTVGGALNLVSGRIPDQLRFDGEVVGGPDASRKINLRAGGAGPGVGWLVENYDLRSDGFKQLDSRGDAGFDLSNQVAKLRFSSDPASESVYHELTVKGGLYRQTSDETYLGLTDSDFLVAPTRRYAGSQLDVLDADHRQLSARYFLYSPQGFDVTVTAYRHAFTRNWYKLQSVAGVGLSSIFADPNAYAGALDVLRGDDSAPGALRLRANNRAYVSEGVQGTFAARLGRRSVHHLEFGVRVHRDREDRFQHEDAYTMRAATMVLAQAGAPGSQSNRINRASAVALYIQDEWSVGRWSFSPGVRAEFVRLSRVNFDPDDPDRRAPEPGNTNPVTALMPGVGVRFAVTPGFRLFTGLHRGFSPPGPGSRDEVAPETSLNYELGVRLGDARTGAEFVVFLSDYDNLLGAATLATGGDGSGDQFNGGRAAVRGLESSVFVAPIHLGPVQVSPRANLTYTHATFGTSFESAYGPWNEVRRGDRLPYLPAFTGQASLDLTAGRFTAALGAHYQSAVRTRASRGPFAGHNRVDASWIPSVSAAWQVTPTIRAVGSAQNVLDRSYMAARRPAGLRPGLPRTVMLGVSVGR